LTVLLEYSPSPNEPGKREDIFMCRPSVFAVALVLVTFAAFRSRADDPVKDLADILVSGQWVKDHGENPLLLSRHVYTFAKNGHYTYKHETDYNTPTVTGQWELAAGKDGKVLLRLKYENGRKEHYWLPEESTIRYDGKKDVLLVSGKLFFGEQTLQHVKVPPKPDDKIKPKDEPGNAKNWIKSKGGVVGLSNSVSPPETHMRYMSAPSIVGIVLIGCALSHAGEPSLGERLEKLAPRASGVAQVEVVDVKDRDARGMDGPLYTQIDFRILKGTGLTPDKIYVTLAPGGAAPPNEPPFKQYGPVKSDTFKKGERYWVAFASPWDGKRYPQGVIQSWPNKDGPKVLDDAIRSDHYAHQPIYYATVGLTYSYRVNKDKKSWRARVERDGKLLWEVDLPGEKQKGAEWRFLNRSQLPADFGYAKENPSGVFLFAETEHHLEAGNDHQLPAGKYRLRYALNADNGKTAAISISRFGVSPESSPSLVQCFDPMTGKVRREERYDVLEKGGLAVGSKTEAWWRKTVRTYDAETGKVVSEQVLRLSTSTYVPINKK
jgi:hypothetical protein